MKTSKVGMWMVAILMVVMGAGFGIAQAGGTHSDRPVLSFEDQEALERGSVSSPTAESRPVLSFEDQERFQTAKSPSEDTQVQAPIEAGAMPPTGSDASWPQRYDQY